MRILPWRLGALLLALLTVSACSPSSGEAVTLCLDVVRSAEKYSSTVQKISETIEVKKITKDDFAAKISSGFNPPKFEDFERLALAAPEIKLDSLTDYPSGTGFEQASFLRSWIQPASQKAALGLLSTKIEYDVDNGQGVPERKKAECQFALDDVGSMNPLIPFGEAVRLEDLRRKTFGLDQNAPNRGYPCCMPRFSVSAVSPTNSKINVQTGELIADPVAGGVIMWDEMEAEVRRVTSGGTN